MSSTITFYTKQEIQEIVKQKIKEQVAFIYKELDKIRNQIADINNLLRNQKIPKERAV